MKSDFRLTIIVICFGITSLVGQGTHERKVSNKYSTMEEMVSNNGYPLETHEIITEDGFILKVFRIPHGKDDTEVNRKPILLMHGMFGQAENFVVNFLNNASWAFFLADSGYDVWIGNSRGTFHSKRHKTLDKSQKAFWDFSYHEFGLYDIPAKIDYILETTNKTSLQYLGHSQGGTCLFVMLSLKPEYEKKISLVSLLAPGGYEKHFAQPLLMPLVRGHRELTVLGDVLNIFEVPPSVIPLPELLTTICEYSLFRELCIQSYRSIGGGYSDELNENILPTVTKFVSSVSTKQLLHFAQSIASGHFRPWDYGEQKNMEIYGNALPLDYPVENIKVPVAVYYSLGDDLAYPQDVEDICDAMKNCVRKFLMPNEKWSHIDFLLAKNLLKELIIPVVSFADRYDENLID